MYINNVLVSLKKKLLLVGEDLTILQRRINSGNCVASDVQLKNKLLEDYLLLEFEIELEKRNFKSK